MFQKYWLESCRFHKAPWRETHERLPNLLILHSAKEHYFSAAGNSVCPYTERGSTPTGAFVTGWMDNSNPTQASKQPTNLQSPRSLVNITFCHCPPTWIQTSWPKLGVSPPFVFRKVMFDQTGAIFGQFDLDCPDFTNHLKIWEALLFSCQEWAVRTSIRVMFPKCMSVSDVIVNLCSSLS